MLRKIRSCKLGKRKSGATELIAFSGHGEVVGNQAGSCRLLQARNLRFSLPYVLDRSITGSRVCRLPRKLQYRGWEGEVGREEEDEKDVNWDCSTDGLRTFYRATKHKGCLVVEFCRNILLLRVGEGPNSSEWRPLCPDGLWQWWA